MPDDSKPAAKKTAKKTAAKPKGLQLPDESQCKGCLHYRAGKSIEAGRHICASFPRLPDWYINNSQKCPVGPVLSRRTLASK